MANTVKKAEEKRENDLIKKNIPFSPLDISELKLQRLQKHFVLDGLQPDRGQRNMKRNLQSIAIPQKLFV